MSATDPLEPLDLLDPARLQEAVRGVRGFVLDADGVLVLKGAPIPEAIEAVRGLQTKAIPFRVVTNFSLAHRESLSARFMAGGLPIGPDRIVTGTSAAATHTAARHPGRPLFVLAAPDARREFDGQHLLTADEAAAAAPGTVAAVVIGDAGEELSYRNLDIAFRLIRGGADFLAMHRNAWWLTPKGETLDAGALVVGLEFATGRPARILGKPSPVVFRQAVAGLVADIGERLPRRAFAMVGDDPQADVAAAQRVGLRGFLVLSGKTSRTDIARLPRTRAGRPVRGPDGVALSLAEVVAALD
jgi:Predicted sugar phosphatases of the HAD superfamily